MAGVVPDNSQEMSVVGSAPDDANRLIICTGNAQVNTGIGPNTLNYPGSISLLVGPVLEGRQFIRAVAPAGIISSSFTRIQENPPSINSVSAAWSVISTDADWDDASGQVEVRVEFRRCCTLC
jgi:hypothetical protein